jgi:hypothetical protein
MHLEDGEIPNALTRFLSDFARRPIRKHDVQVEIARVVVRIWCVNCGPIPDLRSKQRSANSLGELQALFGRELVRQFEDDPCLDPRCSARAEHDCPFGLRIWAAFAVAVGEADDRRDLGLGLKLYFVRTWAFERFQTCRRDWIVGYGAPERRLVISVARGDGKRASRMRAYLDRLKERDTLLQGSAAVPERSRLTIQLNRLHALDVDLLLREVSDAR